jgi:hypothetical protein
MLFFIRKTQVKLKLTQNSDPQNIILAIPEKKRRTLLTGGEKRTEREEVLNLGEAGKGYPDRLFDVEVKKNEEICANQ